MKAFLTVELESGEGYWTLAEFDISFQVTGYDAGDWDNPPCGGDTEDVEITLTEFRADRGPDAPGATLADLSEYQRECIVEWVEHNREKQINEAMEDIPYEEDGPDPDYERESRAHYAQIPDYFNDDPD